MKFEGPPGKPEQGTVKCPKCNGRGVDVHGERCKNCHGTGMVKTS